MGNEVSQLPADAGLGPLARRDSGFRDDQYVPVRRPSQLGLGPGSCASETTGLQAPRRQGHSQPPRRPHEASALGNASGRIPETGKWPTQSPHSFPPSVQTIAVDASCGLVSAEAGEDSRGSTSSSASLLGLLKRSIGSAVSGALSGAKETHDGHEMGSGQTWETDCPKRGFPDEGLSEEEDLREAADDEFSEQPTHEEEEEGDEEEEEGEASKTSRRYTFEEGASASSKDKHDWGSRCRIRMPPERRIPEWLRSQPVSRSRLLEPDLSQLTEEERQHIAGVLSRVRKLEQAEGDRLRWVSLFPYLQFINNVLQGLQGQIAIRIMLNAALELTATS
ncbi:unnamed protein product [Protopolystoma xenopodis]|uniref:Uncharacterized protein n=1 Tax=Protopolystoma xenopodis TaxID=117903 RepID=A0A448XH55_9PLAT|nr:unnamed protein product [Protopolystoma xenopodis]